MSAPSSPSSGFFSRLDGAGWTTLVVGVVGFVLHLRISSVSSTNGAVTSCSYVDVGQFLVAAIGAAAALACLARRRREPVSVDADHLRLVATIGLALAAIHLLWGITGAVGVTGPCS